MATQPQTPVYIEDILTSVVAAVGTSLTPAQSIYFTWGSPSEIRQKIVNITEQAPTGVVKYPLIALVTDFEEVMGESRTIYSKVNCNIVIANYSEHDLEAETRLANNFKQVLFPIYEMFKLKLRQDRRLDIQDEREIPHRIFKRYNYARSQAFIGQGIGADYIDAIEIVNMIISVKSHICLTTKNV